MKSQKSKSLLVGAAILLVMLSSLVQAITIEDVSSNPQQISPGESAEVRIDLENNLEEDLTNVQISLDLKDVPFAPYRSSTDQYIDEMDDGDDENLMFRIISLPDTQPGIYKIPISLSYDYEQGNKTVSKTRDSTIALTINSEPELRATAQDSSLVKGQEGEISVRVVNSGLSSAKFVYLKLGSHSAISINGNEEVYIGDIDSDDFDTAEFSVDVKSSSPGRASIPITLKYKDATNKEYTKTDQILVRTYSEEEAASRGIIQKPNYTLPIILGIAVIGYIVYRQIKKRKRKS